ncbi:hypothetical protein K2173_002470 [Erythroxylum novogranatense]|uniref:Uncharacterized protein n=1 Tax=Erythroxylum novogranatense TaxID=1862640 RepID=A0AAV8T9T5_9ROSI|nr:hypothetical protein K2173_002470 [Erythroxylum novogranatense]
MVTTSELQTRLNSMEKEMNERLDERDKKLEKLLTEINAKLQEVLKVINQGKRVEEEGESNNQREGRNSEQNQGVGIKNQFLKLMFPGFDSTNFMTWRKKVEQFFALEEVQKEKKVKLILLHLEGNTFSWEQQYLKNQEEGVDEEDTEGIAEAGIKNQNYKFVEVDGEENREQVHVSLNAIQGEVGNYTIKR